MTTLFLSTDRRKVPRELGKFNLVVKNFKDLNQQIINHIVIVATGADDITADESIISNKRPLLILDLSIPSNVDSHLTNLDNVTLVNLDEHLN